MPDHTELSHLRSTTRESQFEQLVREFRSRKNIVAEGDSWFAFPRKYLVFGAPNNVIEFLKMKRRFNLLELASSGDEAVDMLSGESKFTLLKILSRYRVDFLLFSGGGNDVVGKYDFDYMLKEGVTSTNWRHYIHQDRLDRRLDQIRNAYKDLIDYCLTYSKNKNIKIVSHCYDYAIPDPSGAAFVGGLLEIDGGRSWMYPYLVAKNVPETLHRAIARNLIDGLAEVLLDLETQHPDMLIVADTRGTVDPDTEWLNEIHPNPDGFEKIADRIFEEMRPHR